VLYDTLLHLGYNVDIPVYRARMSVAHSMEQCKVSVTIPLSLEEPWMATIIGIELDDTVDQMSQVALASLCGSRLTNTAAMSIMPFPVCYLKDRRRWPEGGGGEVNGSQLKFLEGTWPMP
jgi:hypothetical protein